MNNTISVYETYSNIDNVTEPHFIINVIFAMIAVFLFNRF